jgi:single-stranded DNA-binding protein
MNKVILRGHLGDDPRSNVTTTNQKAVCNFRMATNSSWTDNAGVKHEKAEWHNVVCWNKLAISVGAAMRKGSQVLVDGRNETRSYEVVVQKECVDANGNVLINPADNKSYVVNTKETRYTTEIVARTVEFLDKKPGTTAYPKTGIVGQAPVVASSPFIMNGDVVGETAAHVANPATGPGVVFIQPGTVAQTGEIVQGEVVQPVVIAGV